jgi:hypothetical protein
MARMDILKKIQFIEQLKTMEAPRVARVYRNYQMLPRMEKLINIVIDMINSSSVLPIYGENKCRLLDYGYTEQEIDDAIGMIQSADSHESIYGR